MKKENFVKKVLVSSLRGFPIGVTLLMLAYVSIYFITNENVFVNEVNQLENIKTLISQTVTAGLAYCLIFMGHNIFSNLDSVERHKKHPYQTIGTIVATFLIYILGTAILASKYVFSENIGTLNIVISILIYVTYIVYTTIKWIIEENEIRKINKKLEEKNS